MSSNLSYVYRWTHLPSGKWYIGSRTSKNCHPDDGYICSSKYVKPLIEATPSDWQREIIAYGSSKWMRVVEKELLHVSDARNNPQSFNRNNCTTPDVTSTQNKKRMHKEEKNIMVCAEDIDIYLEQGWKLGFTDQVKTNMKIGHTDVSGSNNPMHGMSRSGKDAPFYGKKHSQQTIEKLKKPRAARAKQKMSEFKIGQLNGMFGKKQPKTYCSHCDQYYAVNTYARWHGDNCKRVQRFFGEEVKRLINELKL